MLETRQAKKQIYGEGTSSWKIALLNLQPYKRQGLKRLKASLNPHVQAPQAPVRAVAAVRKVGVLRSQATRRHGG